MAQQQSSNSITTISDTRQDKIYNVSNTLLSVALNSRLSGTFIRTPVRNTRGQPLICIYDFSNIRSAGPLSSVPNHPGCDDVWGPVLNMGQDVETSPECCPQCIAPPLKVVVGSGSGRWENYNNTPSTEFCFKAVSYEAVYSRRAGSGGDSIANQTIIHRGIIKLMVPYQLNTADNLRDTKLSSGKCTDCYC